MLARQEKKAKRNASLASKSDEKAASTDEESQGPRDVSGTQSNPVEIPPETESDTSAVIVEVEHAEEPSSAPLPPDAADEPMPRLNGHIPQTSAPRSQQSSVMAPPETASNGPSKPPAFPTSPVDMAMRTASQTLAVNPLSPKSELTRFQIPEAKKELAVASGDKESAEKTKKRQSFLVRTLWTLIMIGGFLCALLFQSPY